MWLDACTEIVQSGPMSNEPKLSAVAAEEIEVMLVRRRINKSGLARLLGVSHTWVTNRLSGQQEIGLNELQRIAAILNVEAVELMSRADEGRVVATAHVPSGTNERSGHLARRLRRGSSRTNAKRPAHNRHPISRPQTGTTAPTPTGPPSQRRPSLVMPSAG